MHSVINCSLFNWILGLSDVCNEAVGPIDVLIAKFVSKIKAI
ncbi:MAG: hypothetical protein H6Q12_624 [Bacteroidetes bacterium]|nr:hypothetical protein [Bacteroidota bacterium]